MPTGLSQCAAPSASGVIITPIKQEAGGAEDRTPEVLRLVPRENVAQRGKDHGKITIQKMRLPLGAGAFLESVLLLRGRKLGA